MTDVVIRVRVGAASVAIAVSLLSLAACEGSKKAATTPPRSTASSALASSALASSALASSALATTSADVSSTVPTPVTSSSAAGASNHGAKCTDLTDAAASAALGKKVTIKATAITPVAGLTICDVSIANQIYPIQLDVNSADGPALFAGDQGVSGKAGISGLGDKAFHSEIGVEALSGGVDIQVIGPAGPVLNNDFSVPTALVKAMIAAIR